MILWRRIRKEEDGNAAIEFALIAPVLFLLFFGIIEFGLIQFATSVVESASQTSTRLASTGNYPDLRGEVLRRGGGLVDPNRLTVTSQVVMPGGPDGSRDLVLHRIAYRWQTFTPLIGRFFGDGDTVNIISFSYTKNEPY